MHVRIRLQVDEDVAEVGESVEKFVLDEMADAVALVDGLLGINLSVNIDEVFQARFPHPELVDALDPLDRGGRSPYLLDEGGVGLRIHQLLGGREVQPDR